MGYKQINYQDRVTIEIQLKRGSKQKEIAEIIGKSISSISREIKRNSVTKKGFRKKEYLANEAEIKAYQRCWRSQIQSMKINMNIKMKLFIINEIQRKDIIPSPKIIAKLWNEKQIDKKDNISHTSIYKRLETGDGNKYKQFLAHSFNGYRKRRPTIKKIIYLYNKIWVMNV